MEYCNMYKDIIYDALSKARDMFKLYAELHRAKGTVDSNKKAKVNEDMVAIMNEALSAQPAPLAAWEGMDKVRETLAELEDAINAEGFGCACMPDVKCATCKARDLMSKWVRPSFEKLREALSAQPAPASQEEYWQWHADGSPVPASDTPKQPALAEPIQRYALNHDNGYIYPVARGPWVRYVDHETTLAAQAEYERLNGTDPAGAADMSDTLKQTDALEPVTVFSRGPWLFEETGQRFTGAELDAEAFAKYRAALAAQAEKHAAQVADLQKIGSDWWAAAEAAQEERDALRTKVDALSSALRMVGMLRQLGGLLSGSREVVMAVVEAADAALADSKRQTP